MSSRVLLLAFIAPLTLASSACSTVKNIFVPDQQADNRAPISNPFSNYGSNDLDRKNVILRTRKGDRSVEVELPATDSAMTDFVVPVSPAFKNDTNSQSETGLDETYKTRRPGISDHELTQTLTKSSRETDGDRYEIESGLGIKAADDDSPVSRQSYLAALDHIKQLYKGARYEAALIEVDEMLRVYPTDPKLYQMRGTLFDRMGKNEFAIRSWNQALKFDPQNQSLKRFVERRNQQRSIASEGAKK